MKPSEHATRYESTEKEVTRRILLRAIADTKAERVLTLAGTGIFDRELREVLPKVALVSAEQNPDLWPTHRLSGQTHAYVAHCGDFRTAGGRYDFIWLDLTSQWSKTARDAVQAGSRLLDHGGYLAITLLAAREDPEIAADRFYLLPRSIERATGLAVQLIWGYQTGSPMWLLILGPSGPGWSDWIVKGMEEDFHTYGWAVPNADATDWVADYREWTPKMPVCVDIQNYLARRPKESRIVNLADLSPDERRALLAFIRVTDQSPLERSEEHRIAAGRLFNRVLYKRLPASAR
jgi:hypothetical protein